MASLGTAIRHRRGYSYFESGLTVKVFVGALFVGLLMMPGSIYLSYVSGESGAGAAPWVAVILFTELARRSFTTARRQELYMLLGLTGAAVGSGLQYRNFIWYAYFINTPQAASYEIATKSQIGLCQQVILSACSREVCCIQTGFCPSVSIL